MNIVSSINELPRNVHFTVISLPYYQKRFRSEYHYFFESSIKKSVNELTKESFLKLWLRNFFLNFESLENTEVKFLNFNKKVLSKNYVLFCGASPVLETQIEQIKEFRNKFFLISSDTAASFLIHKKIYPNAILSIDSGRGTIFHLRENLPSDSIFFTWLGGNRELFFRNFKKYLFLTSFPLEQILQNYFLPELPILNNPSLNVAGMAKTISKELGAEKIIYAGTSFISIHGKTHCRGTGYENYLLPKIDRKFSLESYRKGYKEIKDSKNELAFKTIFQDKFTLSFDEVNFNTLPDFHITEPLAFHKEINLQQFILVFQKFPELTHSLIQNYSFPQKNFQKYLRLF